MCRTRSRTPSSPATARLSPEARAVARAGAVIGRCFVPELLAGLLDRPLHELDAPLEELVRQSFLHPFSFLDQGYYDFRHQLLRDALYGAVQAGELRRLHARAAEFGGMLPGVSEVHASVHFERAGLGAQAYRAALAGARAASDVSSRREAFELYARAVRNAPPELSELELADLQFAYADAASSVDDVEVMSSAGRAARAHYLAAGERVRAAECLNLLINVAYRQLKPIAERVALADQAEAELAALPASNDRHLLMCDLYLYRAVWALDRPHLADAERAFARARRELDDLDPAFAASHPDIPFYRRDLEYWEAQLEVLRGNVETGLQTMIAVARAARDEHLESSGVTAFRNSAQLGVRVMDYPTARIGLEEGLRYADEIEQSFCRHVMGSVTAHVLVGRGPLG